MSLCADCVVQDVGGREKVTNMMLCLGIALCELDRAFLRKASCIVLTQDVKDHKLLIRFRAAADDLSTRAGVLGWKSLGPSNGSACITSTTSEALKLFCVDAEGQAAPDVLQCIRQKTEMFCADAASDEQLAGQLLRTSGTLPGLRFITKDRSHACQRRRARNAVTCLL